MNGCTRKRHGKRFKMCKHHHYNSPVYPDKALFCKIDGKKWAYIRNHPANGDRERYMAQDRYIAWERRGEVDRCEQCGNKINWDKMEFSGVFEGDRVLVICRACMCSRNAGNYNAKGTKKVRCERTYERTLRHREEMRIKHIEMIHWWRNIHVSRLGEKRTGELRTRAT